MPTSSSRFSQTIVVFALVGSTIAMILSCGLYLLIVQTWSRQGMAPPGYPLRSLLAQPLNVLSAWLYLALPMGLTGLIAVAAQPLRGPVRLTVCILAGAVMGACFDLVLHRDLGSALQYALFAAIAASACALLTRGRGRRTSLSAQAA